MIPFALAWGSFLNVVGYRIINGTSPLYGRSACPECNNYIAAYDLIPVISWLILRGKCRSCQKPISLLYPFIELLTALALLLLYWYVPAHYFWSYALFFSALIVSIRTDLQYMLISDIVTLFLIPVGIALAALGLLPITVTESISGAIIGYVMLYIIERAFRYVTGRNGIGLGDINLLSFIGAFTGLWGCWISLLIGSISGSIIGLGYLLFLRTQDEPLKLPFGPFLAAGAMIYVLWSNAILALIF